MTSLAIDTTGRGCSVAIGLPCEQGERVCLSYDEIGRGHAERVISQLEEVIAESGIGYRDISRVLVSIGPGSFTGIRVGVSLARGIAAANDCELNGAFSTDGLRVAAQSGRAKGAVRLKGAANLLVLLDAGRGELYGHKFIREGSVFLHDAGPFVMVREMAAKYMDDKKIEAVVGPGVDVLRDDFPAINKGSLITDVEVISNAADLLKVEDSRLVAGSDVKPFYLRQADAKPQLHKALARRDA